MIGTVLLVSPAFHGYWRGFAAALETLDLQVTAHCYDALPGPAGRARNAAAHRLPDGRLRDRAARSATDRTIAALRAARPDAVVVVKGDHLDQRWWDAVLSTRVPVVTWLYDELTNLRYDTGTLAAAGRVVSYSPADVRTLRAAGVDAGLLPDGFDSLTPFRQRPVDAVTLVGARYPERERALRALAAAGIPVLAHGREWSRHPWDRVRTGHLRTSGIPAGRDLSRADYYGLMAGSLATLNIHGAAHHGLSMRTFEAPGVGALSLTDRPDVAEFYEVGSETLVFGNDEELAEHLARAVREPGWARGIREAGARRTAAEHTLIHRMTQVKRLWA